MSKLNSDDLQSASPIPAQSILVKDVSGNFRPALAADITALGVGGGGSSTVTDKIETFIAGETISIGDHLYSGGYVESSGGTDLLKQYTIGVSGSGGSVPIRYGQTFNLAVPTAVSSITPNGQIVFSTGNGGSSYGLNMSIYNITGVYGSTAVDTGAALLTSSTTFSGSFISGSGYGIAFPTFIFNGVTVLPAGDYAYVLSGSINNVAFSTQVDAYIYGTMPGTYSGNVIDNVTPVAALDCNFTLVGTQSVAKVSSASSVATSKYLGVSTENKTIGQNILVQTRGTVTQSGATGNGELWYLSNTAGDLSTTPGTNKTFVGKGIDTNKISIRGLYDLSSTVTNTAFSQCYFSGGALINVAVSVSGAGPGGSFTIDVSDDNVTWYTIMSADANNFRANNQNIGTVNIPSNSFARITGSNYTLSKIWILPM